MGKKPNSANLATLAEGQKAIIASLESDFSQAYRQRLKSMGFVVGAALVCIKVLPFKGPLVIEISGSVFSITQELAKTIWVETI